MGNVTICGDASHPSLEILDKVDAWHWKMLSSLQESFNKTLKSKESRISKVPKLEQIQQTLLDFHLERHGRIYALTLEDAIILARKLQ
jgi:hypothetical protein